MSNFSNLPLQDMIAGVVKQASDQLAAGNDDEVTNVVAGTTPEPKSEETPREDGLTDPMYVEKLASAVDLIATNVDNIEPPNRGVLGNAVAKLAGESQPAPYGNVGALQVEAAPPGKQKYKHDKPKPGYDSAASQANTPTSKAELPGGATQLDNNMHDPPGGGSGKTPTTSWENKGPLQKSAAEYGADQKAEHQRIARGMGRVNAAGGGLMGGLLGASGGGSGKAKAVKGLLGAAAGAGWGYGAGYGSSRAVNRAARAVGGDGGEKTAADIARDKILAKLAGEDVMKASVSSDKSGGPLVGDGVMDAHKAEEVPSNPTNGGYNSGQRRMVASNETATNYTKGEAKKPQAKQLAEVLKNPAFSPQHDSKLREQLRNSGQAGVKIAGADAKAILKQAAAEGRVTQETINQYKEAMFGGGGTYGGGAPTPPNPAGGKVASEDDPKVQKLKALMAAQKSKDAMGDGSDC